MSVDKTTKIKYPRLDFSMMPPYALQKEIIEHPARFKIVAIGRQAGKSWLAKYTLLEKAANQGLRCWWVAPTISAAQTHWEDLIKLITDIKFPVKKVRQALKQIDFLSGGSLRIRSAEIPDNLRGGSLDYIVLDEAAFMNGKVWNEVLLATITATGGSAMFTTTPNGRNWLWALYQLGCDPLMTEFKSWNAPSTVSPYQDRELLETIRKTIPEFVWRQEYLAEFLEDAGGVFVKVKERSTVRMLEAPEPGAAYVAGMDWGLSGDFTTFTVIDRYSRQQVFGTRFTGMGTVEQVARIKGLIDQWQPRELYVELNGIGNPMFETLKTFLGIHTPDASRLLEVLGDNALAPMQEEFVRAMLEEVIYNGTKLKGFNVNNQSKRDLIEAVSADIEYGRLMLLDEGSSSGDSDYYCEYAATQISEMSTFIRKRTDSGLNITYEAQEGAHDDTISALVAAYKGLPRFSVPKRNREQQGVRMVAKRNPFRR